MTEIKDKDLEKVGGGLFKFPAEGSNSGSKSPDDIVPIPDSDNKKVDENGYCDSYQRKFLSSESCCKGCVHFIAAGSKHYCDLP